MRPLTINSQGNLSFTQDFSEDAIAPYAILSHTWGADDDEVTLNDFRSGPAKSKAGYSKIPFCLN
jgi:hypothetical protein